MNGPRPSDAPSTPIRPPLDLSPQGNRLLHVLLTHASDAVIVRDAATGVVIDLNERAERLYGVHRGEIALLPPGWPSDSESVAAGSRPRWQRRRDGRAIPVEVAVTRIEIDGRALVLETIHDLSDPGAVRVAMEARLAETDALLDLASALTEAGGLEGLLDGIVAAAVRFAGADFGAIGVVRDGRVRITRLSDGRTWLPLEVDLAPGRLVHDGRIVTVADAGRSRVRGLRALARHGVRSLALAPIHARDGRPAAVLAVGRRYAGLPYDERQLALLDVAARHAGAAIERERAREEAARLHEETLRRSREIETMLEATSALNAALEPEAVVHELSAGAASLCRARAAAVALHQGDSLAVTALCDGAWSHAVVPLATRPAPLARVLETGVAIRAEVRGVAWSDGLAAAEGGLRWHLAVPLLGAGRQVLGVLALVDGPDGEFTEHDEMLTTALAAQGAVALERARSREELADSIAALSRSEERFRSIVQNVSDVITLIGADGTVRYQSPSVEPVLGYQAAELVGREIAGLIHPDDRRALVELGRTDGSTPQRFEVRVRHKDGSWRSLEAVATNLLDDPSVRAVVVHSRDITERIRAERGRRFLADAVSAATADLDERQMLERVARLAVPFLGDWCAIHGIGAQGAIDLLALAVADGCPAERYLRGGPPIDPAGGHPVAVALRSGRSQSLPELDTAPHGRTRTRSMRAVLPRRSGVRSWISAPLFGREAVQCVISVGRDAARPSFNREDLALLEELCRRLSLAVENARLYRELAERKEQLEDLVHKLLTAHEEERRRVAYEVHDGVAQVAAAAHQHLQAYLARHRPRRPRARADLEQAVALAQRTVREARRVVGGLRPTVLDDFGLATALRQEADLLRSEGWRVRYVQSLGAERLPADVETVVFRVAQEAIVNARKHSGARRLLVLLLRSDETLRLLVRDWGRGFPDTIDRAPLRPGERVGIAGMHERVVLLGGTLEIASRRGGGVRLLATVPLGGDR